MASAPRLALLDLLRQGPRTVEALAREVGLSLANASQHLKVLHRARLVEAEKRGLFVTYRLADPEIGAFCRRLRLLAESRLAEIERVLRRHVPTTEALEALDREALLARVARGEVTVLDVRPVEEYEAGHIPGALSVPLEELESRLDRLPHDQEIVAYCRGPYCLLAVEAVELLRARGFDAKRLEDSMVDWRAQGLAVET